MRGRGVPVHDLASPRREDLAHKHACGWHDRGVGRGGEAGQDAGSEGITAEERQFAKEVVLRYLSKIKPPYVKVSRQYGEQLCFAGGASEGEEEDAEFDLPVADGGGGAA
jgi:hypothetical protein